MRYLITDINAKQDSNFKNVINFVDTNTRDKYINRKLFNQGTRYDYTQNIGGIVVTHDIKPNGDGVITINSELTHTELSNKNYIILDECGVIKFYFINEVRKIQNSSEYKLTLKEDVFCTYPDVMTKLKYLSLIEGHVPVINYANYTFKEVAKNPIDRKVLISDVKPTGLSDVSSSNLDYNNTWIVVFRQLKGGEEGCKLQTQVRNHNNEFARVVSTLPFKMFGAPIINRGVGNIKTSFTADVEDLLKKYQEDGDGKTFAIKIVPFEFDNPGVTMTQYDSSGYQFVEFKEMKGFAVVPFENSSVEFYEQNQYTLQIPNTVNSVLELLEGVNEYSLSLDGVKDFKIPLKYLFKNDDGEYVTKFQCLTTFAPGSTKEGIVFDDGINDFSGDTKKLLPIFEDEYTWTNDTDMAVYVNQLSEYKANNPNSGLEYLKPLEAFANPLTYLKPASAVSAGVGAITGTAETAIQRNSMKKAPMQATGDSATYFQMNSTVSVYTFMITQFKFVGNERKAIIDLIYRNGLQLDNQFLIDTYEDIKRPKFNYIRSINATESLDYESEYPESVVEQFANIFNRGVRVWQDIENFKVYDSKWADNGEGIDDFIKNK